MGADRVTNNFNISSLDTDPDQLIVALIVFLVFYVFLRFTKKPLKTRLKKTKLDTGKVSLLVDKLYSPAILMLGLVASASQLGVDITAALAGMGVLGIAVSFAAKDALGNIISGFMIYWDRPFKLGDWIEIGEKFGKVTKITLRTTRLKTLSNSRIVLPNTQVINEALENFSAGDNLRIKVKIGIGYEEPIDKAKKIILKTTKDVKEILEDPKPEIVVEELGDSAVIMSLRVWTKDAGKKRRIGFILKERIKLALDKEQIEMPYPTSVFISKNS